MDRRRFLLSAAVASVGSLPRRTGAATDTLDPAIVLYDPDAPALANPEGDVTVVEYFDYQCPVCRAGYPMIREEAARDPRLRLVMKDWPIFGPASLRAAQIVLGAAATGDYGAALEALMLSRGGFDEKTIRSALLGAGLDMTAAEAAYSRNGARIDALIARNTAQADAFGLPGTPGYIIGHTLFAGTIARQTLRETVRRARG